MRKIGLKKDAEWALDVFDKAPYVTVSMVRDNGMPYGLPLSLVRKDSTTFYFHCAGEGEKLDCLNHCPTVSLSAVSRCTPKFEEEKQNFTEYYHSAVAIGRASIVTDRKKSWRSACCVKDSCRPTWTTSTKPLRVAWNVRQLYAYRSPNLR